MQGEATEEAKEGETPAEPIKFDVSMDKMKEEVKEQFLFMFEAYMQYLILTGLVRNGSYDAVCQPLLEGNFNPAALTL